MWFPYRSQTYHLLSWGGCFKVAYVLITLQYPSLVQAPKEKREPTLEASKNGGGVLLVACFCWENGWIFEKLSSVIADHGAILVEESGSMDNKKDGISITTVRCFNCSYTNLRSSIWNHIGDCPNLQFVGKSCLTAWLQAVNRFLVTSLLPLSQWY